MRALLFQRFSNQWKSAGSDMAFIVVIGTARTRPSANAALKVRPLW